VISNESTVKKVDIEAEAGLQMEGGDEKNEEIELEDVKIEEEKDKSFGEPEDPIEESEPPVVKVLDHRNPT